MKIQEAKRRSLRPNSPSDDNDTYITKNCNIIPYFKKYEVEKRNLL
jgi:hypothetical protein